MTQLNLVVLRSDKLDITLAFYQALGCVFVQEQHGTGPLHYASEQAGLVLEIFPAKTGGSAPDYRSGGGVMLGFQVGDLSATLNALHSLGITPPNPAKETTWGWRALVFDPDGRAIELIQPIPQP